MVVFFMIQTIDLSKNFGHIAAVKSVNLVIEKGEVFGLLGPNGAGKTTTIRMLTTLTLPSAGTANIAGHDIINDPLSVKTSIGVIPQMLNLDIDLTLAENLEYHGRLHRMGGTDRTARIEELLRFVGLWEKRDVPVEHLSGGMRRRLLIARGLMHRPQVVFMDEPTVGLDPQARRLIWGLIDDLKRSGITILLTTHYIEEADELCDRVAIMRQGKVMTVGAPADLKALVGRYVLECLGRHDLHRQFLRSRDEALDAGKSMGCDVVVRDVTLEDVFIELTGERIDA
jgi:ABC-2 type transport system ATP-binding protein